MADRGFEFESSQISDLMISKFVNLVYKTIKIEIFEDVFAILIHSEIIMTCLTHLGIKMVVCHHFCCDIFYWCFFIIFYFL